MVAGAAQAETCWNGVQAELALVSSNQDWREFNTQGKQLVLESGILQGPRVGLQTVCNAWQIRWDGQWLGGERSYEGQTNGGVPATSRSSIASRNWGFELAYALSANWALLGRIAQQHIQRTVADTPSASGFSESFDWSQWQFGLVAQWPVAQGQLQVRALWGEALDAGMQLQLAGKDTAYLNLGPVHSQQLQLSWSVPIAASWEVSVGGVFERTSLGPGAPSALYQNGVPVVVAQQPRTEWRQTPLQFGLIKRF